MKLFFLTLILFFYSSAKNIFSQPTIVAGSFEYIWEKSSLNGAALIDRSIIIAGDDSAKALIRNSFAKAFKERFYFTFPDVSLSAKPLALFATVPKFNTNVKNKKPGEWYLFLQVFDKVSYSGSNSFVNKEEDITTTLTVKCKLVDGSKDSVIMDRTLVVNIAKEEAQPGQVLLKRLPAYPGFFIQAFDSIAYWLFKKDNLNQSYASKSLLLKPAVAYVENSKLKEAHTSISFERNGDTIRNVNSPGFYLISADAKYEKIDTRKNVGGNIAGGVITLLTGVGSEKRKTIQYLADFPYKEDDNNYHVLIKFFEDQTAEREREKVKENNTTTYTTNSGDLKFTRRYIDPDFYNAITLGTDTIAIFKIKYSTESRRDKFKQVWDGSDSASIKTLPAEWNNRGLEVNSEISGKIESNSFLIKTSQDQKAREIYMNDQLVLILYGNERPKTAMVFKTVTVQQLKLFTILCSLPFSLFHYHQ